MFSYLLVIRFEQLLGDGDFRVIAWERKGEERKEKEDYKGGERRRKRRMEMKNEEE